MSELRFYTLLIDIHRNVNTYCTNLWKFEWRCITNNKLRQIKIITNYWFELQLFNRKDEVVFNRLRIGHSTMSYGHLMRNEEPTLCLTCEASLIVKHLINYRNYMETRSSLGIPDSRFKALNPNKDNCNLVI